MCYHILGLLLTIIMIGVWLTFGTVVFKLFYFDCCKCVFQIAMISNEALLSAAVSQTLSICCYKFHPVRAPGAVVFC